MDLHDAFPDLPTEGNHYCGREYWKWESDVAKPAIEAAGFTDIHFFSVEEDSFGPLIRGVTAIKNGIRHEWEYG